MNTVVLLFILLLLLMYYVKKLCSKKYCPKFMQKYHFPTWSQRAGFPTEGRFPVFRLDSDMLLGMDFGLVSQCISKLPAVSESYATASHRSSGGQQKIIALALAHSVTMCGHFQDTCPCVSEGRGIRRQRCQHKRAIANSSACTHNPKVRNTFEKHCIVSRLALLLVLLNTCTYSMA